MSYRFPILITLLTVMLPWTPLHADTLRLEFAQEGEPLQARALIVLHDALEDRTAFANFFHNWSDRDRSWARSQYCSVYSYEYERSGLTNLATPREIAEALYAKVRSNRFAIVDPDDVNPQSTSAPKDPRQPGPTLEGQHLELLLAGHGYGGLVARELALLAKKDGRKVKRLGYIGTPLDGLSTIDLILAFTLPSRALSLGLTTPLDNSILTSLSQGWWSLVELFDSGRSWSEVFAPARTDQRVVTAYGSTLRSPHPTDNVLYGRHRRILNDGLSSDGFVPHPLAWGTTTGPMPWLVERTLEGVQHADLTKSRDTFIFIVTELIDKEVTYEYLWRRQQIEDIIKATPDIKPLYIYWDERDTRAAAPQWREAYASRKGLYQMMWGVAP